MAAVRKSHCRRRGPRPSTGGQPHLAWAPPRGRLAATQCQTRGSCADSAVNCAIRVPKRHTYPPLDQTSGVRPFARTYSRPSTVYVGFRVEPPRPRVAAAGRRLVYPRHRGLAAAAVEPLGASLGAVPLLQYPHADPERRPGPAYQCWPRHGVSPIDGGSDGEGARWESGRRGGPTAVVNGTRAWAPATISRVALRGMQRPCTCVQCSTPPVLWVAVVAGGGMRTMPRVGP